MALSVDETRVVNDLTTALQMGQTYDEKHDRYYEGRQRLEQIGLAVPPELRRFETVVNWPRLAVDSLNERLEVKTFMQPGSDLSDPALREGWDANDLDSEAPKLQADSLIYGRAFATVGTNEDDREHPLISIESPRELVAAIDSRTRRVTAALRLYGAVDTDPTPQNATLYLPDTTVWMVKQNGRWVEEDRDDHMLGRVPVVPFYNRLRPGRWHGVSEMHDVIGLTDAAARTLTNLQLAGETHAVPGKWALGVSKGDFVDASGNPLPVWEAYMNAIWATSNADAKIGQFNATSLSNFHDTVNHYARLVSALTGLPPHFLGFSSDNPASADAIRSSESRLVKRAELKQRQFGDAWARVMAYYARLRDGEWPDTRQIKVEWYDPATPTVAARTDAVVKLFSTGIVSREGAWDELGWSEARKARERDYFTSQQTDPLLAQILKDAGVNANPAAGA